jgi:hypothetical protein
MIQGTTTRRTLIGGAVIIATVAIAGCTQNQADARADSQAYETLLAAADLGVSDALGAQIFTIRPDGSHTITVMREAEAAPEDQPMPTGVVGVEVRPDD